MSKINYDYLKPDYVWYEYDDKQGGKKFFLASIYQQRKIARAIALRKDSPRNQFEVQKIMPGIIPFDYYERSQGPQSFEEIMSCTWPRTEYQMKAIQDLEAITGVKPVKPRFNEKQQAALAGIKAPVEKEPEDEKVKTQESGTDYDSMTDEALQELAVSLGLKPATAKNKSREALINHITAQKSKEEGK